MKHLTYYIFATILFAVFCSSCTCYRSSVEADFHEHNADSRAHQKFTASWKEGAGFHNEINPVLMIDTRSASGEVQIISHQPAGIHSTLVFETIQLTNRSGGAVPAHLPPMPLSIRYQETKSSRYVGGDKWADYRGDFAKLIFKPEVSISGSPYTVKISGHHIKKNGTRKPFGLTIRMDLSRDRRFENIANCWP